MKFVVFFFCSFLVLLSCKKDTGIQPAPIAGTWVWSKTYMNVPLSPTNPLTPQNSGNSESIYFLPNGNWKIVRNGNTMDSGTYSLGHGSYLPNVGSYNYVYDSIGFYKGNVFVGSDSYEIKDDTLTFRPGLSGRFTSYLLPYGGSKWFTKY